ncbi:hypothetical protein LIX17_25425 (plasmid) [Mycobacterium avium subsp. hominissuis]|uniref:hypothetical protein n=1 Tax=Mycobacterium avium TaxID=1764 RepID=UPI0031408B8A
MTTPRHDPQLSAILDHFALVKREGNCSGPAAHQLRNLILEEYQERQAPPRRLDAIRLMTNLRAYRGWSPLPCSTVALTDTDTEAYLDDRDGSIIRWIRRIEMTMLLYADEFVEQDPLSFEQHYAGPFDPESAPEGLAWRCMTSLDRLSKVKPLIDAGILIMAPIADDPDDSMDSTDTEFEQYLRARGFTAGEIRDLSPFEPWYLRDARRNALLNDATLIPTQSFHWHYLAFLDAREAGRHRAPEPPAATTAEQVASSLLTLDLPIFAGAPVDTLVKIHQNEEAFAEWRAALRGAARQINATCTDSGFQDDAREVYEDMLLPITAAVDRATKRSRVLKNLALEQAARVSLGATLGYASSTMLGLPPTGAVSGAVVGGLTSAAYGVMRPEKPKGAAAIISMLKR